MTSLLTVLWIPCEGKGEGGRGEGYARNVLHCLEARESSARLVKQSELLSRCKVHGCFTGILIYLTRVWALPPPPRDFYHGNIIPLDYERVINLYSHIPQSVLLSICSYLTLFESLIVLRPRSHCPRIILNTLESTTRTVLRIYIKKTMLFE